MTRNIVKKTLLILWKWEVQWEYNAKLKGKDQAQKVMQDITNNLENIDKTLYCQENSS